MNKECEHTYIREVCFGQKTGDMICTKCNHTIPRSEYSSLCVGKSTSLSTNQIIKPINKET